jgi:hypothetical protein
MTSKTVCDGQRTAEIQRRQRAVGLERPGQCLSTRNGTIGP